MDDVLDALRAQIDELDGLLRGLDDRDWLRESACPGWSVGDVVLHLAQTNEMAVASVAGSLASAGGPWARLDTRSGTAADVDEAADQAVAAERGAPGEQILCRWRDSTAAMVRGFATHDGSDRVQWVAGDMAARTLASTRIAETWIHTEDVARGLGVDLAPTARLWHVARLVHRTLPYAFARAGEPPPGAVRFALVAPDDTSWVFGDDEAPTAVEGPAVDLCRVAGQRLAAADTSLRGTGPDADRVLALARTFA